MHSKFLQCVCSYIIPYLQHCRSNKVERWSSALAPPSRHPCLWVIFHTYKSYLLRIWIKIQSVTIYYMKCFSLRMLFGEIAFGMNRNMSLKLWNIPPKKYVMFNEIWQSNKDWGTALRLFFSIILKVGWGFCVYVFNSYSYYAFHRKV